MEDHDLEEMSAFFNLRADTYDSHMLDDLGLENFYEIIASCFNAPVNRLLDLGCGTGLELERLFKQYPYAEVTGIDMSEEMLKLLELKYPDKKLRLICGSYFSADFGEQYDGVLSTYSMHHFSEESKLGLYRRVHDALEPGGVFIYGDYTVRTIELQHELIAASDAKRREQGIADSEIYHFDTPFTAETEIKLMTAAGFAAAEIIRQWESATIIIAKKRGGPHVNYI
jgi:tRNA (cmo5U34)-methyltransferase